MSLMTWIVLWTVVTTVALVLAYVRLMYGLHEIRGLRLSSGHQEEFYKKQLQDERRLNKIDIFGIPLTAASVLMMFVIVISWLIEQGGMSH